MDETSYVLLAGHILRADHILAVRLAPTSIAELAATTVWIEGLPNGPLTIKGDHLATLTSVLGAKEGP